jgi:3-oxoacyl-[acyl-carrier protein] reductase
MSDAAVLPVALNMRERRVLVTGAASGIGRATATALAMLGASLLLADRASLAATRGEVQRLEVPCDTAEGDLADDTFLASLFARGRLHAAAHCAAILEGRPWRDDPQWRERFHRVMDINVRVPLAVGTACVDHMAEHGGGALVLVGSVAGRTGGTSANTPPDYAASKGAVHTLVKWLSRNAIKRGVMVNGVAPGPVETAMTRSFDATASLPLGRLGKPEELAWPIAFLCTPAASYLSGAILDVNGGAFVG